MGTRISSTAIGQLLRGCRVWGAGCVVTIASLAGLVAAQPFEMARWTIDGGGTTSSQGGSFHLAGTIGQPDAGVLSSRGFELSGGFWFEIPPTDCDDDGIIGLLDAADFVSCLGGPAVVPTPPCLCFDTNGNGTVDLADFVPVQTGFHGD